jgi:enterobacteria phage integrase
MAVLKLKHVNSYRDRHGKQRHYFRRGATKAPLPGLPGSAVFMEEYNRLLSLHAPVAPVKRGKAERGSLSWVITEYKATSKKWAKAKPSTIRAYERYFGYLDKHYGTADFASFDETGVRAIRNKLRDTPSIADEVVNMIGMLWRFAKEHLGMDALGPSPTVGVAAIHTEHEPHKAWPPELCAKIENHKDPKVVRAYFLLRYTGQRRSDVVCMKASQYDGLAIQLIQEKTGEPVWLPVHKALRDHLTTTGIEGDYLLLRRGGKPMTGDYLGEIIREAVKDLGYPGYSAHGLRHLAGASLAEAGCSVHEIMAVLGHVTEKQAIEYTRQANRKVLAGNAVGKWEAERQGNKNPDKAD